MQKVLTKITQTFVNSEFGREDLKKYAELRNQPGWGVHTKFHLFAKTYLLNSLLGKEFRSKSDHDKIIEVEVIARTIEALAFFEDPIGRIERATRLKKHSTTTPEASGGSQATKRRP